MPQGANSSVILWRTEYEEAAAGSSATTSSDPTLSMSKEWANASLYSIPFPIKRATRRHRYTSTPQGGVLMAIERFDYINSDENDAVQRVKPNVYFWLLFEHVFYFNPKVTIPRSEPLIDLDRLAWGAAHGLGDWEEHLMARHFRSQPGSEKGRWLRSQSECYVNFCYLALRELIAEGKLEIVIDDSWPALRLTMAVEDAFSIFHNAGRDEKLQALRVFEERLQHMPYGEYLQSESWRARRQQHLEAAGNRCQLCNSPEQPLHVHHRTYANRGRERFYDLVVLCAPCHEAFHRSGRTVR